MCYMFVHILYMMYSLADLSESPNWLNFQLIYIIFGLPMILMVAVGYKTKLVSVTLIFALFIHNIRYNNFWRHRNWSFKVTWGLSNFLLRSVCLGYSNESISLTSWKARKPTFSISKNSTFSRPYLLLAASFSWLCTAQVVCRSTIASKQNNLTLD